MSGEDVPQERLQDEQIAFNFETKVKKNFPEYTGVDKSEYFFSTGPAHRGRLLTFYTEKGNVDTANRLRFIFKPSGYVINYYNTPEPEKPYTIRNRGNSVYGPRQERWQTDEVDYALEKVKIHREGIDHKSEEFKSQLADYSEVEQRFVTFGDRLDQMDTDSGRHALANEYTKRARRNVVFASIWDLYDHTPDKARDLVIERLKVKGGYASFEGKQYDVEDIIRQIRQETQTGNEALKRELNIIDSYERLLKDRALLL